MPDLDDEKKPAISAARIGIWVVVGVIGVYMVVSGVLGGLGVGG